MKDKPLVVILASLLGFYLGCHATPSADLTDQDRAAIQKVSEDGIKMLNAPEKDVEAFVEFYYAENAMTLSPNEPAIVGRASQIAWYKSFPPFELKEEILELDGRGDLAYARASGTLKLTMPGATEPIIDTIKGMEIWKKQKDGSWKVACDIFNSDLPIKAPTEPTKK
jgi:ketosteroid isomerase-like protein